MKPILYISGPYSPLPGLTIADNIALARKYAAEAWKKGWAAITPHMNTSHFEIDCAELPHEAWLEGDLTILHRLRPHHDAILMIGRWQESKGAKMEETAAWLLGLKVFYADAVGGVPEVN